MPFRLSLMFLALALVSVPAFAVTLTNKDDKDRKLTIVEGASKQDVLLKPNGVLEAICLKGCLIRLGDSEDDEYLLEGPEVVSIEDNKIYDDGPDPRSETAPGVTSKPPPPQPAAPPVPSK